MCDPLLFYFVAILLRDTAMIANKHSVLRSLFFTLMVVLYGCSDTLPKSYQPLPSPIQIGELSLYDQNAATVTAANLQGQWTLMFFGYTYCPDVCPTTLAELNQVAAKVQSDQFNVILVSVDPERDNPEQLKNYITYFNPKFHAWSGELEQLQQLTRQLHIFFQKQPYGDSYLMDHSSQVVLINPQGQYQGFFTAPLNVQDMVDFLHGQI